MTFEDVHQLLNSFRTKDGIELLFLVEEQTMRSIYDCIVKTNARECLELGTGYGATACVIAAALHATRQGLITTVDRALREPFDVNMLAQHTGLEKYINAVADPDGYNWFLKDLVNNQSVASSCVPCIDFCFLDGAHEWNDDALAVFLLGKLLRPGAWLALDDLNFKMRGWQSGWEKMFAGRSERQFDAYQVRDVFDLIVRQSPDFGDFTISDCGRTGWARKKNGKAPLWRPTGVVLDVQPTEEWEEFFSASDIVKDKDVLTEGGLVFKRNEDTIRLIAQYPDPGIILPITIHKERFIDTISLRIRLLEPAREILQIYWTDGDGQYFDEARSIRARLNASDGWTTLKLRIKGGHERRRVRAIRIDVSEGPSRLDWTSLSLGGYSPPG